MHHLFVTNDFPPKHGGIQTMLWELWRRLDPSSFTVFTTPYDGAAEWDPDRPSGVIARTNKYPFPPLVLWRRVRGTHPDTERASGRQARGQYVMTSWLYVQKKNSKNSKS